MVYRASSRLILVASLCCLVGFLPLVLSGCGPRVERALQKTGRPLVPPKGVKGQGEIAFVPVDVQQSYLEREAQYFRDKLGVPITVTKPLTLGEWDPERNQYKASAMVEDLRHYTSPDITSMSLSEGNLSRFNTIIAVTKHDMYFEKEPLNNFVFAQTLPFKTGGGGISIISQARLNPAFYGQRHSSKIIRARLRKFLAQKIGNLHYGLPRNNDPSSSLYQGTQTLQELDAVGEGF